jgi:putative alpha-1,2-mannosidase
MGGRQATEQRLDSFFAYPKLLTDPASAVRNDWITKPYDYYGKPTYNPNNEPDLLAPYMYLWAGAPAKTATVVRAAMTLFTTGPDGMTGNDDLGTMSAWYVFATVGMYPQVPGRAEMLLTSPSFPRVVVTRSNGVQLVVRAGAAGTYVQRVTVDGLAYQRSWLAESFVNLGGTVEFTLGSTPNTGWATAPENLPRDRVPTAP